MQSSQKLVKIQQISSNKCLNFTANPNIALKQVRQKIKNLEINLSPYIFLMGDKSPISKQSQLQINLYMILTANNTFYVQQNNKIQIDLESEAVGAGADVEEQIKIHQKIQKYQQFQQKIQQLKQRLAKFNITFATTISSLPNVDHHYQGQINQFGLYQGIGRYRYDNGQIHIGEFKEGQRHGLGCYTFQNGDRYEGQYKKNVADGLGIQLFSSGASMAAIYKKNASNGIGIYYFGNGQKLLGQFKQNSFEGEGVRVYTDGTWKVQNYEDGQLID